MLKSILESQKQKYSKLLDAFATQETPPQTDTKSELFDAATSPGTPGISPDIPDILAVAAASQKTGSAASQLLQMKNNIPTAMDIITIPVSSMSSLTATTSSTTSSSKTVRSENSAAVIDNAPKTHDAVHKSVLETLKNNSERLEQLARQTENGKYIGTKYGSRMYGEMITLSPQASFKNLEMIIAMSHADLIVDAGIPVPSFDKLSASFPPETHLKDLLCNSAAYSMFEVAEEILKDGEKIFLIADKGANKGAHTHFVKIVSWYSKTDARVKSFNLDSYDYDGSSEDCSMAVSHELVKLFGPKNVDNILS